MSIELKQAAQQALDAFEDFGDADDFATMFALTQKMNALRTAIQQAEAKTGEPIYQICKADSVSVHSAWVDVDKQAYDDAGLYPEYRRRMLYTHPAPGVPVGQAPSVWNSIQIASWIGSQLMHEPSMFERNAVCKFVRSLGRHPTLLKHSPKDTHPAPGVPDGFALVPLKATPKVAMVLYEGARRCFSPKVAEGLWQDALTAAQAQKDGG